MSRIRSIKPGFFKDEDLSELPIVARYIFSGLWCQADREGRLEDRPKLLKLEIVPWDDVDMDAILNMLTPHFITRYVVDGKKYIQINNFTKHQIIPNREPISTIPAQSCTGTVPVQYQSCTGTVPVKAEGEGEREKTFAESGDPALAPVPAKPKPDPRHGWFLRWFVWSAGKTTDSPYLTSAKDAGIVKTLLKIGLEELVGRSCHYLLLADEQRFPRGSPTLPGLLTMANTIAGKDSAATYAEARRLGILPPEGTPFSKFTPWKEKASENSQFQTHRPTGRVSDCQI